MNDARERHWVVEILLVSSVHLIVPVRKVVIDSQFFETKYTQSQDKNHGSEALASKYYKSLIIARTGEGEQ